MNPFLDRLLTSWLGSRPQQKRLRLQPRRLTCEVLERRDLLATITTFAGGYEGDSGLATLALLSEPNSVAIDAKGDIFIADSNQNRIREVVHATGIITTIAGTGSQGYLGDGGQAINALLNHPLGITLDPQGNVVFADSYNEVIRKIDLTTGKISTIVGNGESGSGGDGGLATAAQMSNPTSVVFNQAGDLFFNDFYNNRIRKINHLTNIVTTVAGSGSLGFGGDGAAATQALLSNPASLAIDSSGNLFIADTGNQVIRKVDHATGFISTIAGKNGIADFAGDNAAATKASLNAPMGIVVDAQGNIDFADSQNDRIRQISPNGIITTIAGNGDSTASGDGAFATLAGMSPVGLSLDSQGNLLISEARNNLIRLVDHTSKIISTVAGKDQFLINYRGDTGQATSAFVNNPIGIAVDSTGNVFIAEPYNNRIREVNYLTGIITTIAGTGGFGYSGDGGQATNATLASPHGLTIDSQGNLYIADTNNNVIRKVNLATGIITTTAKDSTGNPHFQYPTGVAVDSAGNLFIADNSKNLVSELNHATGKITTYAGTGAAETSGDGGSASQAKLNGPYDLAIDATNTLYISEEFGNRIRRVNPTTHIITTYVGSDTGSDADGVQATNATLNIPLSMTFDNQGNLFFTDFGNHKVREVNKATGIITTVTGNGAPGFSGDGGDASNSVLPTLAYPVGIALDTHGNLYIADSNNNRVRKIDLNPVVYSIANQQLTIDASGSHQITLQLLNPLQTQIVVDGNVKSTIFNYQYNQILVNCDSSASSFKINPNNGNPIPSGGIVVNGGTLIGSDRVNVWYLTGTNAGNLNGSILFTNVTNLVGGSSYDSFIMMPGGSLSGLLDGGAGRNYLDYTHLTSRVVVSLSAHAATGLRNSASFGFVNIQDFAGNSSGANLLVGPIERSTTWNITAANAGNIDNNTYTFSLFQNLAGSAGNDQFILAPRAKLSGYLDGGNGINTLDYSAWSSAIYANLTTHYATSLGRVFGMENVLGGSGNDTLIGGDFAGVLIGGDGNDTITAGAARTIIIGGFGIDTLIGGLNGDIFIGTATIYDTNISALIGLLSVWTQPVAYTTRVNSLRTGTSSGIKLLFGTTLYTDLAKNILSGPTSTQSPNEYNWFVTNRGYDQITARRTNELVD